MNEGIDNDNDGDDDDQDDDDDCGGNSFSSNYFTKRDSKYSSEDMDKKGKDPQLISSQ